jgi:hypothetical protein
MNYIYEFRVLLNCIQYESIHSESFSQFFFKRCIDRRLLAGFELRTPRPKESNSSNLLCRGRMLLRNSLRNSELPYNDFILFILRRWNSTDTYRILSIIVIFSDRFYTSFAFCEV